MRDLLLLAALAATFAFGFWLMKKLDDFLEASYPPPPAAVGKKQSSVSSPPETDTPASQAEQA